MAGGQSGVNGHVSIADNTTVAAQTGVLGTIRKPGITLIGYPALEYGTYMRAYAKFRASGRDDKHKSE